MGRITVANAKEMAARSHAARRMRLAREELATEPLPQAAQSGTSGADDSYVARRLLRVRGQISKLDDMLEKERDPLKIDKLCSAIARLAELERHLAGRPLPGSRRPSCKPERPRMPTLESLDPL